MQYLSRDSFYLIKEEHVKEYFIQRACSFQMKWWSFCNVKRDFELGVSPSTGRTCQSLYPTQFVAFKDALILNGLEMFWTFKNCILIYILILVKNYDWYKSPPHLPNLFFHFFVLYLFLLFGSLFFTRDKNGIIH